MYNINSGYGQAVAGSGLFNAISPNGRQFFVGAANLDNIQIMQQIFKHDGDGQIRIFTTLVSALAGVFQNVKLSVTASTSADTLTTTAAHGLNNGDKFYIGGTTAPTGTTAGVVYYVVGATTTTFQVAANRGGAAIDITGAGTAVTVSPLVTTGDTIFILPSHNETISTATALDINISGITIVGLGQDETRPTFTLDTATTAVITVSAPAVTLKNVIIDATGFDAIATAILVTASDFQLLGCKLILANATNQATIGLTTTAQANRLKIDSCYFYGTTDAGTTNALQLVGGNDIVITNNIFYGAYTTSLGAINNATTAMLRATIKGNIIFNQTASSTKAMVFVSTSTGHVSDNRMQILSGTAPITGAAMSWVGGNYYAAVIATAGTLI